MTVRTHVFCIKMPMCLVHIILFLQASFSLTAVLPFFVHEPRINMTTEPSMGPPNFLECICNKTCLENHQHHGKNNSPQLCVGFLFLILYPGASRLSHTGRLSHTTLSRTIFHTPSVTYHLCHIPSFTYHLVTYHFSHTTLSHTIFVTYHLSHTTLSRTIFHTHLCHLPSFTYNFLTHHLSHTICHIPSLSHTIFHTQLCHTPSFTPIFVTYHLSHTTLSRTIFHTNLCHIPSFTHNFLTHHLSHTICHIPSLSHTIFHTQLCHTPSFTPIFVTYHLSHTTFSHTLRGRRGTRRHPPSFCVAGVALMALRGALGRRWSPVTPRHFAWQAWHLETSTFVLRGRRRHPPSVAVGRRGTWRHATSVCVAGVAQGDIHIRFAWQAWHLATATFVLRGRRGTYGTAWRAWSPLVAGDAAALCVAGVAQGDIHLRFAWQAWHKETSTFVSRGRRATGCTWWHAWSPLVAGDVAALCVLGDMNLRFAWQTWHKETSTFGLRGRRGTWGQPPSFCVAGVALMALRGALGRRWSPVTPRHFAWQAWHLATATFVLHGRRGTRRHPPLFCVAGVALMALRGALGRRWSPVTPRHFAWQAWHLETSTFVLRGRRGTRSW